MSLETEFGFAEQAPLFVPPPGNADERLARLRLIRSHRVGPSTYLRLIGEHGSARQALDHLPEVARAAGVSDYMPCPEGVALAELKAGKRAGARPLYLGEAAYPATLADIPDPPPVLWMLGDPALLDRPRIAVVGTRNASALGARMARHLAGDLGAGGMVVVSGLARGIDALAHQAALDSGTIAVQAGGLDVLYPAENAELAREIGRRGLRLSEMPFGMEARARHFPKRNRIVSGLCLAVVVVEAALRSGSMITARAALEQGREVMAVPGHPLDSRASGGNALLRDGALLVRNAADILEALDPALQAAPAAPSSPSISTRVRPTAGSARASTAPPVQPPAKAPPTAARPEGGVEGAILATLGATAIAEDQLVRDLGHPPRAVAQALAILELAGRVRRSAGGMVQLA
jgi:DNA processing protein